MSPPERTAPAPEVVANHFVRQYYGRMMMEEPAEVMRFYSEDSTFVFESGTKEEAEPVSGTTAIKAKLQHLGLVTAERIDVDGDDSVEAKSTSEGEILIKVTGWVTTSAMEPRRFWQTFLLSREHRFTDRHNFYIREDIFRFFIGPDVGQVQKPPNSAEVEAEASGAVAASPPSAMPCCPTRVDNDQRELDMVPATSPPRAVNWRSLARGGQIIKLLLLLSSLIMLAAVCGVLLFMDCRPPPCARGDALHGGDPALVPGECIAAAMGSRSFGWLPWLPWQPMLTIEDDGEIIATRPDGTRVTLARGYAADGRKHGFLSRLFAAPARGSFEAHLNRLPRGGGHVAFTKAGDLYVADAAGIKLWSLAEEVDREREREGRKRGGHEGAGRECDILLVH